MKADNKDQTRRSLALFVLVLACGAFFAHARPGDNVNSRLDLVAAILNDRAVSINPYHYNTIDKASHDGHFYPDKAPGSAMAALPVALAYKTARGGGPLDPNDPVLRWLATFFLSALPSALLAVLFWRTAARLTGDEDWSLAVAMAYSLGSLALPYSALFYGHQLSALFLFALFLAALRADEGEEPWGPVRMAAAGCLAAFAFALEYPSAIGVTVFGAAFFAGRRRPASIAWAALGAALPAAAWMAYNRLAFGSWIAFGYEHEQLDYFREGHNAGLVGVSWPKLNVLHRIAIHPGRGLFYLCPAALLGAAGFPIWLKSRKHRAAAAASLSTVILFFLFNAAVFNPEGGMAVGPRYLIPMLPFLFLPAAFFGKALGGKAKIAAMAVGGASIAQMALCAAVDPQVHQTFRNPLYDFCLPLLKEGAVAETVGAAIGIPGMISAGLFGLLTLAALWKFFSLGGRPLQSAVGAVAVLAVLFGLGRLSPRGEAGLRLWMLGKTAAAAGRTDAGERFFKLASEADPKLAQPWFSLALLQANRGESAEAEASLKKAAALNPGLLEARHNLGIMYARRGAEDEAAKEFEAVVAGADAAFLPQAPKAALMLGRIYLKKGDCLKAAANFEFALKHVPGQPEAVAGLNQCKGEASQ